MLTNKISDFWLHRVVIQIIPQNVEYAHAIYDRTTSHKFFKFDEVACGGETLPGKPNSYIHLEVAVLLV